SPAEAPERRGGGAESAGAGTLRRGRRGHPARHGRTDAGGVEGLGEPVRDRRLSRYAARLSRRLSRELSKGAGRGRVEAAAGLVQAAWRGVGRDGNPLSIIPV